MDSEVSGKRQQSRIEGYVGVPLARDLAHGLQGAGHIAQRVLQAQVRVAEGTSIARYPLRCVVVCDEPLYLLGQVSCRVSERHVVHPRLQTGGKMIAELTMLQENLPQQSHIFI